MRMTLMTPDEVVAELRDGMTIGIGGWGSRRKPMALVRAIARSPLKNLTVVCYAGPDAGLLVASGQAKRIVTGFASLDSIALEPHFRRARQDGTVELTELDEGMLHWGLLAAAHRLPFLPIRAGLGSGVLEVNPDLRTVRSPYGDPFGIGEDLVAMPALRLDAALVHMNRADATGNGQYLGPDPYFDDLFCLAASARVRVLRADRAVPVRAAADPAAQPGHGARRRGNAERRALHQLRPRLRPRRGVPGTVRPGRRRPGGMAAVPRPVPGRRRSQLSAGSKGAHRVSGYRGACPPQGGSGGMGPSQGGSGGMGPPGKSSRGGLGGIVPPEASTAEVCVVACAEAWRGDGAILASPMGLIPSLGARLARLTFAPDLLLTDGEAYLLDADGQVEGWLPYAKVFTMLAAGRRHVMMGAAQIDRYGNQNISCIGDWKRPKAQLLGVRGAPGNTVNHPVSYWIPRHSPRVFVSGVDMVCGVGYDRGDPGPCEVRVVVTNLAVLDFGTAERTMRLRSVHPGVQVGDVLAATGFPLVIPDEVPVTRPPTAAELDLIRTRLDPGGTRERELW